MTRLQEETTGGPVRFDVQFSGAVSGVDATDFMPVGFGSVTDVRSEFGPAASGGALDFTSVNHRAFCENFNGFPNAALTVEFWCRTTASSTGNSVAFFSYAITGEDNEFQVYGPDDLGICIAGQCLSIGNRSGVAVDDGNWHHVAVTWESAAGTWEVYKNGVLEFTGTFQQGATLGNSGTLVLADEQDSLGGGFNPAQAFLGQMDEFRFWNTVRTQAQIQANLGRPLKGNEAGLVAYWPMDSLGQVINNALLWPVGLRDHSFRENHASLRNGTPLTTNPGPCSGYTVSVDPSIGLGPLRLDVLNDGSIVGLDGTALAGGTFIGDSYTIVPACDDLRFDASTIAAPQAQTTYPYSQVVVTDLNGDARPDMALLSGSSMDIYIGNGQGGFTAGTTIGVSSSLLCIDHGDLNGDGNEDLVVSADDYSLSIYYGDGQGGFPTTTVLNSFCQEAAVKVADMDGDGDQDIVVAGSNCGYVQIQSGGVFGFSTVPVNFSGPFPNIISTVDFDGDGLMDVIVGSSLPGTNIQLLLNTGTGFFATSFVSGGVGLAVEDFDRDGLPDLAFFPDSGNGTAVRVLLNDGLGGVVMAGEVQTELMPLGLNKLVAADFNRDGKIDLIVQGADGSASAEFRRFVLLGDGHGGFGNPIRADLPAAYGSAGLYEWTVVADINLDGLPDVVTSYTLSSEIGILINRSPRPRFQQNGPTIASNIDGVETDGCFPAAVTKASGEATTWNIGGIIGTPYDSVYSFGPLAPRGTPQATELSDGQVLNIDLQSNPTSFLNGGTVPSFQPLVPFSLPFAAPAPGLTFSLQGIALDFSSPSFFTLSQGLTLDVRAAGPATITPIIGGEDQFVHIMIPEHRGRGGSIPFYGTLYSEYFINENGRVSFVAGDTTWNARPEEAVTGPPSVGFWTDLSSQLGIIQVANGIEGDHETIRYFGVPYYNEAVASGSTFSISFDAASGAVTIDVSGIVPNPVQATSDPFGDAQWLGISNGFLGATLGTPTAFAPGEFVTPALTTDMVYDFWDGFGSGPTGVALLESIQNLQTGAGSVTFVPITLDGQVGYMARGL